MQKKHALILLSTISMLASCGPSIKYVGFYYEPSDKSKIYFRTQDIENEYEVMGRVYAKFGEKANTEKIQKAMTEKAKKVGADGVIMSELQEHIEIGCRFQPKSLGIFAS